MKADDRNIPSIKSTAPMRAIMRQKARAASLHPDTGVTALGDFIDILLDDVEILEKQLEEKDGSI